MQAVSPKAQRRLTDLLLIIVLVALAILVLIPFAIMLMTAIRPQADLIANGVFSWPGSLSLGNFARAWDTGNFSTYMQNSVILVMVKVPLGIALACLAAYPLAKMNFRFGTFLFLFFLFGLTAPIHITLVPMLIMLRSMGLTDTVWALLPPYVVFGLPFQIFVMRGYFRTIPNDLLEAARMDGCSELGILWRILAPLSVPALVTLFIIDTLATWNELLMALVFISSGENRTVPVGLLHFQGQFSSNHTALMAGVMIAVVPILILYLFLQRYLVAGITAGALKE